MFIFINNDINILIIVNQIRLFYFDDIYIILEDLNKDYISKLKYIYNINIIDFNNIKNINTLMFKYNLTDGIIIDNCILYDNPFKYINNFNLDKSFNKSISYKKSYNEINKYISYDINNISFKNEFSLKKPNNDIFYIPIINDFYILSAPIYEYIITGEKIQKLCDIYIGNNINDFNFNPNLKDNNKYRYINEIKDDYDNPKYIYTYTNNIKNINFTKFKNKFILISGNSDLDIIDDNYYKELLNNPNLILWISQNICIRHHKLQFLPIGIANSQWKHGNLKLINELIETKIKKINNIYFCFDIGTNSIKRFPCYNILKDYIPYLNIIDSDLNIKRLSEYKFCICPEGNGVDTHRLWECWYLKIIPIVIRTDFIEILMEKIKLPIIILNKWEDLIDIYNNIEYDENLFKYEKYLDFNYYRNMIINL